MPARKGPQMPSNSIATALGQQLKYCRVAAQFSTQVALADKIRIDDTLVAKAESGARPPSEQLYKAWMAECGVGGQLRSALDALWILARSREDPVALHTVPWAEAEGEAHTLRYWAPILVPGLVQTEDYARMLFIAWGHGKDRVDEMLAVRMKRFSILDRQDPPDVTIILWDRLLTTLLGSAEIMRDQIGRLLEISERPNVHVHVLPSSVGANMGLSGQIDLATTNTTEVLLMEGFSENIVTADNAQVRRASANFNSVRSDALPRAGSRTLLLEAMEAWDRTSRGESPATAPLPGTTAV